jgi:predicted MFS family arabinose efflux permease
MSTPRALATTPSTVDGRHSRDRGGRRLVAALAVTQTIGYGVLYYAFAVFLTPMATELHTSTTAVTGAATLSVLVTAVAAVPVGRWLDRHGGRALMTAGSILASLAVAAWSQVDSVGQLYAVFAVIGAASAMVLYEPAFAIIVARFNASRRPGVLLAVTIVAGFASSIFLPLAGLLEAHLGWRHALLILAVLHAVGTIGPHALALPRATPTRTHSTSDNEPTPRRTLLRLALRERGFWLLVAAFVAHSAAVATIAVHLVTYLSTLGHSTGFAATVAGLIGVLSVTGRLVTTGLRRRYATTTVTAAVFALQALAAGALPVVGHTIAGAVACVVVFGLGFGVATIARPALLADRYDTSVYATVAATLATPATVAKAAAPLGGAAVATAIGYTPVMVAVAALCLAAAAALSLAGRAGEVRRQEAAR